MIIFPVICNTVEELQWVLSHHDPLDMSKKFSLSDYTFPLAMYRGGAITSERHCKRYNSEPWYASYFMNNVDTLPFIYHY